MNKFDCYVGLEVYFGRPGGEQTRARVTKVNRVKVKVEQLEPRRQGRRPVGTIWTVPPSLLSVTNEGPAPSPVDSPKPRRAGDKIVFPESFYRGDKVTFVSSRTGMRVTGWVKRVNRKTVSVEPEGYVYGSTYYRVPPHMLSKV
jgi:hypothetical protein